MTKETVIEMLKNIPGVIGEAVPEDIPHGDMPGDKVQINAEHIRKTCVFMPSLAEKLTAVIEGQGRAVISVFGGSGVGKSETASLIAWYLTKAGVPAYVLSGDNYPRRIPQYNDAERARIFRAEGLKGMVAAGVYTEQAKEELKALWAAETDAAPSEAADKPWLAVYQKAGRTALTNYLGTVNEQDFDELNNIIAQFHDGKDEIMLKRMGRTEEERWYSAIDFSNTPVLIIEWTHGGNALLQGVDLRVMLNSTPEETREHRRLRARDGKTDSAFTTMVLEIEQGKLQEAGKRATIILSKSGEMLDPATF